MPPIRDYEYEKKLVMYELVPKLIYLISNYETDYVPALQLGENPPIVPYEKIKTTHYTNNSELVKRILITFFITQNRIFRNLDEGFVHIYDDVYALKVPNRIYKCYRFGKVCLEAMMQNLYTNPRFIVNKAYAKLIKVPVGSWLPVGRRLTNIIHVKLLLNNMTLTHGATIMHPKGKATAFIAGAEVGKTSLVFNIAFSNQVPLLAEDVFVTDGLRIFPCPYTTTYLRSDIVLRLMFQHELIRASKYRFLKVINRLNKLDLLWGSILKKGAEIIDYIRDKVFIKEPCPVENVILMIRDTKNEIKSLDVDEALRRVLIINRIEFDFFRDILISAYIGTFPSSSVSRIQDLMEREEHIIKQMLERSKNLILIKFNSHEWLKNTVLKVLFKK